MPFLLVKKVGKDDNKEEDKTLTCDMTCGLKKTMLQ